MTLEQRDAVRIALVHLMLASAKDPKLEKTIEILRDMIDNKDFEDQMTIARNVMVQDKDVLSRLANDNH